MATPYVLRSYAGGASATSIPLAITASATSFNVADGTGYPTTNFFCVLDAGTALEEKVFIGSRSGNTFSSVARGEDGTVGKTHTGGATVAHVGVAQDFSEANAVASTLTTKGDVMVRGTAAGPARLPVGSNGTMLTADSVASLGVSWQLPVPAGTMLQGCWAIAPTGYLLLDGSTVTNGQTLYPLLWAVIPAAWKTGANIVLPDARGRVLVGAGTGTGLTNRTLASSFGEENHTLTTTELPSHSHGASTGAASADHTHSGTTGNEGANHTHGVPGYSATTFNQFQPSASSGLYAATEPVTGAVTGGISVNHQHGFTTGGMSANHAHGIGAEGGGAGHNVVQPSFAVSIVIKT